MLNKLTNNKQGERNMSTKNIDKVRITLDVTFTDTNSVTARNQIRKWLEDQFDKSGASDYVKINNLWADGYVKYTSTIDNTVQISDMSKELKNDLYFDIQKKGKVKKHWKELTVQEWYDYKRGDSNIEVIEERA